MNKRILIYISLIIFILVSFTVFTISFAFIGTATVNGNTNVEGNILYNTDGLILRYSGDTSLGLILSFDNLSKNNSGRSYDSSKNISVKLLSDKTRFPNGISCSFDVYYEPEVVYTASTGSRNNNYTELSMIVGGSTLNLDNIIEKTKIYSGTVSSDSSGEGEVILNCIMRFYNLRVDQSDILGQKPSGNVVIESGECGVIS